MLEVSKKCLFGRLSCKVEYSPLTRVLNIRYSKRIITPMKTFRTRRTYAKVDKLELKCSLRHGMVLAIYVKNEVKARYKISYRGYSKKIEI